MKLEIMELNDKAKEDAKNYPIKRFLYEKMSKLMKTVLLRQLLLGNPDSFYLSLDAIRIDEPLFSIAKELEAKGTQFLFLDEIHFLNSFEKELKKIYDFLKINIIFTSSCALSLHASAYDLSRRVRIIKIPAFSFRELIFFEKKERIEELKMKDILDHEKSKKYYSKTMTYEVLFEKYMKGNVYPFVEETSEIIPLFNNILETVLSKDVLFSAKVTAEEANEMRSMIKFIGKSPAEGISYSSISSNLNITKYKSEKYVSILEKAFILNRLFPKGTNVLKEPKILFALPYRLIYKDYSECIGALREDFFVESILSSGLEISYLKTNRGEKTPDYLVEDVVIEIGGRGKGRSQFKGMEKKKKIILTHPGLLDEIRRPLFFAGMMY